MLWVWIAVVLLTVWAAGLTAAVVSLWRWVDAHEVKFSDVHADMSREFAKSEEKFEKELKRLEDKGGAVLVEMWQRVEAMFAGKPKGKKS